MPRRAQIAAAAPASLAFSLSASRRVYAGAVFTRSGGDGQTRTFQIKNAAGTVVSGFDTTYTFDDDELDNLQAAVLEAANGVAFEDVLPAGSYTLEVTSGGTTPADIVGLFVQSADPATGRVCQSGAADEFGGCPRATVLPDGRMATIQVELSTGRRFLVVRTSAGAVSNLGELFPNLDPRFREDEHHHTYAIRWCGTRLVAVASDHSGKLWLQAAATPELLVSASEVQVETDATVECTYPHLAYDAAGDVVYCLCRTAIVAGDLNGLTLYRIPDVDSALPTIVSDRVASSTRFYPYLCEVYTVGGAPLVLCVINTHVATSHHHTPCAFVYDPAAGADGQFFTINDTAIGGTSVGTNGSPRLASSVFTTNVNGSAGALGARLLGFPQPGGADGDQQRILACAARFESSNPDGGGRTWRCGLHLLLAYKYMQGGETNSSALTNAMNTFNPTGVFITTHIGQYRDVTAAPSAAPPTAQPNSLGLAAVPNTHWLACEWHHDGAGTTGTLRYASRGAAEDFAPADAYGRSSPYYSWGGSTTIKTWSVTGMFNISGTTITAPVIGSPTDTVLPGAANIRTLSRVHGGAAADYICDVVTDATPFHMTRQQTVLYLNGAPAGGADTIGPFASGLSPRAVRPVRPVRGVRVSA